MSRRFHVLLVLGALSACETQVVVGRFRDAIVSDGGAPDAGSLDAAVVEPPDAATADAGVVDAGVVDAGHADLSLAITSAWATEVDGGPFPIEVTLQNLGRTPALDVAVDVAWPAEVSFVASADCTPQMLQHHCVVAQLDPAQTVRFLATVDLGAVPQIFDLSARSVSSSPERDTANNYATFTIALTPAGTSVAPISGERVLTISACNDPAATTFSRCTVANTRAAVALIHADGGIDDTQGARGAWWQGVTQRNLAWRYLDSSGFRGSSFIGGSVSAQCFEGVFDEGNGPTISGAWRGCLN